LATPLRCPQDTVDPGLVDTAYVTEIEPEPLDAPLEGGLEHPQQVLAGIGTHPTVTLNYYGVV